MTRPDSKAVAAAMERFKRVQFDPSYYERTFHNDHREWYHCDTQQLAWNDLYYHDSTPISRDAILDELGWVRMHNLIDAYVHEHTDCYVRLFDDGSYFVRDQRNELIHPQPQTIGDLRQLVERMEREESK